MIHYANFRFESKKALQAVDLRRIVFAAKNASQVYLVVDLGFCLGGCLLGH